MNFFKDCADLLAKYFGRPAHKLPEKEDKLLVDLNALLVATFNLGYQTALEDTKKDLQNNFNTFDEKLQILIRNKKNLIETYQKNKGTKSE